MKEREEKKRQKVLKRRTERKQAVRQARAARPTAGALHHVHQAGSYPIEGCWIQPDWKEHGLAVVVIARRQLDGNLVVGLYLIDYYCLGLKDTDYHADIAPAELRGRYLPNIFQAAPPVQIPAALAHEIVYGGIEYAAQFGFHPHADFRLSQYILDPPELHPRSGVVEFGYKGKPLYISGPRDHAKAIVRQLARTAGEGNFDYVVPVDGSPERWEEEGG